MASFQRLRPCDRLACRLGVNPHRLRSWSSFLSNWTIFFPCLPPLGYHAAMQLLAAVPRCRGFVLQQSEESRGCRYAAPDACVGRTNCCSPSASVRSPRRGIGSALSPPFLPCYGRHATYVRFAACRLAFPLVSYFVGCCTRGAERVGISTTLFRCGFPRFCLHSDQTHIFATHTFVYILCISLHRASPHVPSCVPCEKRL